MARFLALLVFLVWIAPAHAQDDSELVAWLKASKAPDRGHSDLVKLRRSAGLVASLQRIALDQAQPESIRLSAVRALGAVCDSDPSGLSRLSSGQGALAVQAARAVKRIRTRRALLATLRPLARRASAPQDDPAVRELQAAAGRLPPDAVVELVALAGDPLLDLRRAAAARLLGWVGGPAGAKRLGGVLRDHRATVEVFLAALRALETRGDDLEVEGAFPFVLEQGRGERVDALITLLRGKPALLKVCRKTLADRSIRAPAKALLAERLGVLGIREAAKPLKTLAGRPGFTRLERCRVVSALLRLGGDDPGVHYPMLVRWALDGDTKLSELATTVLARHPLPEPGLDLETVFAVPDPGGAHWVRAIQLASVLRLDGLVVKLSEVLKEKEQPLNVRQAAAHALGVLGGDLSYTTLAWALEQKGWEQAAIRREAADALHALASQPKGRRDFVREALEGALTDPEPTVRRAALRGLVTWGDPRSRPAVRGLLRQTVRSPSRDDRLACLQACTQLKVTSPESARLAARLWLGRRDDTDLGLATVEYFRRLGPQLAVPALIDLLEHRSARVFAHTVAELVRRYPPGVAFSRGAATRREVVQRWGKAWSEHAGEFR